MSRQLLEKETTFTVDSQLLFELGERLVAKPSIALAELVKNSYDADATEVIVTMENIRKPGGTIIVKDNGEGITAKRFIDSWMRIATSEKRRRPYSSKYNRVRVGFKGVGRFACRVLSKKLVFLSVATTDEGRKEKIRALFDWETFKPGKKVDEIRVRYTVEEVSPDTDTGLTLRLLDVREAWSESDVSEVQKDLLALVSPFPPEKFKKGYGDPGFKIVFKIPEFKKYEQPLWEQFLSNAWGVLKGSINQDGKPTYTLEVKPKGETFQFKPDNRYPRIGPANFIVYMVVYDKDFFPDLSLSVAKKFGETQGGVRIYLDSFRAGSYGDPGDDWLDLDRDRGRRLTKFRELQDIEPIEHPRPMLLLPGTNQLFGAIFLSRNQNPSIEPTVTRDRLIENRAFRQLKRFVRLGLEWMTVQYSRFQVELKALRRKPDPIELLETQRRKIEKELEKRREELGRRDIEQILLSLDTAIQTVREYQEDRISEISMLRVLSSAGTMVAIFDHELRIIVGELHAIATDIDRFLKTTSLPELEKNKLVDVKIQLDEWIQNVERQAFLVGAMLGEEARLRRKSHVLRQLVSDISKPFLRHFKEYGIDFINDVPPTLRTPLMYQGELHSILLNPLTNSIKALKRVPTPRKIAIKADYVNNMMKIQILDTGPGVPVEKREEVFEPFVSTSEPDEELGLGTGLGLSIVKDLVRSYGGDVEFVDPPEDWNTCLQIKIPKEV